MSINSKVHELRELRQMAEELEAEIETIEDSIKEQMRAQGVDTLHGPDWKVTWKPVTSSRLDTSALKAEQIAAFVWHEKSSHIPATKQEDMEAQTNHRGPVHSL